MEILVCAHCEAALTRPVTRVRFPPYAHRKIGNGTHLPVLMETGTYAVDPEPSGPPWHRREDLAEGEAEARGYYGRVWALSDGPPGRAVLAPADALGTVLAPERVRLACCGITGENLSCAACGHPVGGQDDMCEFWQAVRLDPRATRPVPAGPDLPPADWAELVHDRSGPRPIDGWGRWSERCGQEATLTLVDLLFAAAGSPVAFEPPAAGALFGRALDHLLYGLPGPAKRCALHGPGRPLADPLPGLALVPRHPRTDAAWPVPPGVRAVELDVEIWRELAFADGRRALRVGGRLRAELERDDPLPPHHWSPVYFDDRLITETLVRTPPARRPTLGSRRPW
ncbi:hypothetical protein [Kitasatospora sp. NPDC088134]|uniref:hypothetical protein n=1 Tax=Kitasatospora sp. NPDC088134 TaxID=3364071 RepID=UPI003821A78A